MEAVDSSEDAPEESQDEKDTKEVKKSISWIRVTLKNNEVKGQLGAGTVFKLVTTGSFFMKEYVSG